MHKKPLSYHIYTIWLFTRSDLKTIVGPSVLFAFVSLLSGPILTADLSPSFFDAAKRLPRVLVWIWINLLPFNIDNQRQTSSIAEDLVNKSWRPLPSGRLTPEQATYLMLTLYPMAFCSSLALGGFWQCIGLMGLGYWYNDLKGGDRRCVVRNFINACGYLCFTSGALLVGSDGTAPFLRVEAYQWFMILASIIFTTIQTQDLHDQAGDSLRRRATVPLVIGDSLTRYTLIIPLLFWSFVCPIFWQLRFESFILPIILAAIMGLRYVLKRSPEEDKLTFYIYNLWIISLFSLPCIGRYTKRGELDA